ERGERRIRPVGSLVLADEPHRRGEVAVVREAARIASETADRLRAPFDRLFLLDLREEALDGGIAVAMLLAKRSRDRRHTPREGIRHARVPIDEIADESANFVAVRGVRDADRELVGLQVRPVESLERERAEEPEPPVARAALLATAKQIERLRRVLLAIEGIGPMEKRVVELRIDLERLVERDARREERIPRASNRIGASLSSPKRGVVERPFADARP